MGEFRALLTLSNGSVTMYSDLKRHDDYIATAVDAVVDHSCTEIPTEAFAGFAGLKSVLLPESLEVIHDAAFEGCFNLNKINFPDRVSVIGNRAFRLCSGLAVPELPKSLEVLGEGAFTLCDFKNKGIDLPDNLYKADLAFAYARGVSSAYIPESLMKASHMFEETGIRSVVFSDKLKRVPDSIFEGCKNLEHIGAGVVWQVSDSLHGKNKIPDSVLSIGIKSFAGTGIDCITGGAGLEKISRSAFAECRSMVYANFENCPNLNEIGMRAFFNDGDLEIIELPNDSPGIDIKNSAFSGTGLMFPVNFTSVKSIGACAFDRTGISELVLDHDCVCEPLAFSGMHDLIIADLPAGKFKEDGRMLFLDDENLCDVRLYENINAIGSQMFGGCRSLAEINIPKSVSKIADDAFAHSGIDYTKSIKSTGFQVFKSYDNNLQKTEVQDQPKEFVSDLEFG